LTLRCGGSSVANGASMEMAVERTDMAHVARRSVVLGLPVLLATTAGASAESARQRQMARDVDAAFEQMYRQFPRTRELVGHATGVLMFPRILKAGLLIGGQTGDGELRVHGHPRGHYNLVAASYGLQIGAQQYSMAMFFMTEAALRYLDQSDGWQVGVGPSVVVADEQFARSVTTTTITQDVMVIIFGQSGLMAGVGVEGSKITRTTL
jgi:lipid-binding SYLF domain-containing protein